MRTIEYATTFDNPHKFTEWVNSNHVTILHLTQYNGWIVVVYKHV